MSIRVISLFIAVIASMTAVHGSVPIIVSAGAGKRAAGNLCNKAENQLKDGDVAGAKRSVDAALHIDPKFWPALYQRARIFAKQGQYSGQSVETTRMVSCNLPGPSVSQWPAGN